MAISKEEQEVIDSIAEVAAESAAALYAAFIGKTFSSTQAFKLTQTFLYETVKDADTK